VIGTACRLPGGVHTLDDLSAALDDARDAITPPPPWRGFDAYRGDGPGRSYQLEGGWLDDDDVRGFDPTLFGMNAREARDLDPQQRLLLTCAREALDDAQVEPGELGRTGVYVGLSGSEYKVLAQRRGPEHISPYIGTGTHPSAAAGRLAYLWDLEGPAVAIDTACSSGIVALHHAIQALRSGDLDSAIVGAVNVLLDPEAHVSMAAMGTLSRRGACHSYSAHADGYVRSEGCVVLVLRRGEGTGRAVIRGSASNQDGRSSGLTAPRASAQEAVLRAALAQAEVAPADVAFHEGHGSATPLGDRVELTALGRVFAGRQGVPLGSAKARFGHLEAAAGLAGVLHAMAIVERGTAPAMPHATPPTLALAGSPMAVPTAAVALSGSVATVSGFGIAGTNAAVVLQAVPQDASTQIDDGNTWLCLSGPDEAHLEAQRVAVTRRLAQEPFAPLARASQRGLHDRMRQAVWAGSDTWAQRLADAPVHEARDARLLLAFPGQGVARPGMGSDLVAAFPEAREAFDEVSAIADPLLGRSLADRLWRDGEVLLQDMPAMQVGVFAVGLAYVRLLERWGVQPAATLGHSSGEWAAAVAAGMVSVEDAVRVLVRRGELLEAAGPGAMWALFAPADAVTPHLVPGVGIAALNHPAETVISGPPDAVEAVAREIEAAGFEGKQVPLSIAGHAALLEPVLPQLAEVVDTVTFAPPRIPLVSTALADIDETAVMQPSYWVRQFRDPVRLQEALEVAHDEGFGPLLEAGPHPRMASAGRAIGMQGVCLGHGDLEPSDAAHGALATLWSLGVPLPKGPRSSARKPGAARIPRDLWLEGAEAIAPCWQLGWAPVPTAGRAEAIAVPDEPLDDLVRWGQEQMLPWLDDPPEQAVFRLDPSQPAHEAFAGWLRSVRWERPSWSLGIVWASADVELPPVPPGEELRRVDDRWQGRRLRPLEPTGFDGVDGHWVITGGFGALGLRVAAWLVDHGASELTLVGRRGCPPEATDAVEALRARVVVHEAAVDVAQELPPGLDTDALAGVVHDSAFFTSTPADRASVFAPKVAGTDRLLAALAGRPDVWFVGFSSLTGTVGGEGQSAYGAANAHLDAAIRRRCDAGGRGVSIGWGPWAGAGLAAATLDRRDAQGLPPMDPRHAVAAMATALGSGHPWVGVVSVAPEVMKDALRGHTQPLWSEVVPTVDALRLTPDEDHQVMGRPWLSAADQLVHLLRRHEVAEDVRFVAPVEVPPEGCVLTWSDGALRRDDQDLLRFRPGTTRTLPPSPTVAGDPIDLDALYDAFRERGVVHGPGYRRTVATRRDAERVWARAEGGTAGQRLDALLSCAAVWADGDKALLPAEVSRVQASDLDALRELVLVRRPGSGLVVDAFGTDGDGQGVLVIAGLRWAAVQATSRDTSEASRFAGLDADTRTAAVQDAVRQACADVLQSSDVDPSRDLMDQGLDSILALELRDRLAQIGLQVPLHRVVGGASPDDLAAAAEEALGPVADAVPAPSTPSEPVPPETAQGWESLAPAFFIGVLVGATVWALIG